MKRLFAHGIILVSLTLIIVAFFFRVRLKETAVSFLKPKLPDPKPVTDFLAAGSSADSQGASSSTQSAPLTQGTTSPKTAPQKFLTTMNLDIPFQSQAPFGNWDLPYQETCEEAAAIMVHRYFSGEPLDPETMDRELLKLVDWENATFGDYKHTSAEEIAKTMREYFGHADVEVRYEFTIDDIKREISKGHPVILPAAGRLLPNPYFQQPGPLYHAVVVKGYTQDQKIITNDPGTRRGKDFIYDPDALMNAIHDWNPANILEGKKAMIVVKS